MNVEGVRKYLTQKFQTEFLAEFPDAVLRFENVRYETQKEKTTEPIVFVFDEPIEAFSRNLGLQEKRLEGSLHIIAQAPENIGTKRIREYIDTAAKIFYGLDEYVAGVGYFRVREIYYNTILLNKGVYTIELVIRYQVDFCE